MALVRVFLLLFVVVFYGKRVDIIGKGGGREDGKKVGALAYCRKITDKKKIKGRDMHSNAKHGLVHYHGDTLLRDGAHVEEEGPVNHVNRCVFGRVRHQLVERADAGINGSAGGIEHHVCGTCLLDVDVAVGCLGVDQVDLTVLQVDVDVAAVQGLQLETVKRVKLWEYDADIDTGTTLAVIEEVATLVLSVVEHIRERVDRVGRHKVDEGHRVQVRLDGLVAELSRLDHVDICRIFVVVDRDVDISSLKASFYFFYG